MKQIEHFFPERLRKGWNRYGIDWDGLQEIRIRVNQPVILKIEGKEVITEMIYTEKDIDDVFRHLCHDSVYAYEMERCQGYLTLPGGHRVGITGELTYIETTGYFAKYIRYMNIRIAHEKKGIAERIMTYLKDKKEFYNTLIISSPGIGKTTLLRDIVRMCSQDGYTVGVIDERGEIAGAFRGAAGLDCGVRTDVMTGGEKNVGVRVLVRTFSPQIIAMDEIGVKDDAEAICYAGVSGCKVVATIHGTTWEDLKRKEEIRMLIHQKIFQRMLFLSNDDKDMRYVEIWNGEGELICGRMYLQAC